MTQWDLQSINRDAVPGPSQFHAYSDYKYQPYTKTFLYTYCGIR